MLLTLLRNFKPLRHFLSVFGAMLLAGITLLLPLVTLAGDSLTVLETAGRFSELQRQIEARLSSGTRPTATLIGPLCVTHQNLKQYAKLFECLAKLEQLIRDGDTRIVADYVFVSPADARPLPDTLRAEALLELGRYEDAIATGLRALEAIPQGTAVDMSIWPPLKYRLTILPILAIAAVHAKHVERAKQFVDQLEATPIPFVGGSLLSPVKENGLARAYMAVGAYDKALGMLAGSGFRSVAVALTDLTTPFAYRGDSVAALTELRRLVMRSKALIETAQPEEAKAILDQLVILPRLKDMGDLYWIALFERGRVAETDKELGKAAEFYRQAVEAVELQRSTISTEASKIGFVGDKQALYGRLVAVLIAQDRIAEAFDYVERSKSRALVDVLATKQDFAAHGDPKTAKTMLARLDTADLEARAAISFDPSEGSGRRTLQVVHQELRSSAPELSSLVTVNSVPSEELRALIRPDETLVEYYYQGTEFYAFVLNRTELKAVRLDGNGLVAQVQAFRNGIENPQSNKWMEVSRALYARLWQPLEGEMTAKNVIVVAHGALHYLPFTALLRPDGSFLVDRHSLRLLPSASVLKFLKPTLTKKQAPVLAFGNPDLGDPKLDLRFAEGEAKTVASLYPASKLFTRKTASETAFKQSVTAYSRIHFATHGKFQADAPLTSGLYLTGDVANDGLLTVGELYSMNINADLVTLSACETGLGKIANGDDVVGLARGFLYAGSRAIVASLWSVDDKATAELMQAFYRNLATLEKSEALRQAQLKARKSYPHPYYWAAFQLTGRSD